MRALAVSLMMSFGAAAIAGEVEVVDAELTRQSNGAYTASVTLRHADTGWDHYADAWEVRALDGTVLGTRTLYHPHVNEQPFTRSLRDIRIPDDLDRVVIHGHDSVHGWGGATVELRVPR